jgi:hypothetical protein
VALVMATAALADVVSVKDFGAAGNGVADDTAAIQAALDAVAGRGGGTVLVPAGTYVVAPSGATTWLKVGSDTTVQGAGESATVFRVKKDAGDYQTIFGQASPSAVVRNVRFAGFRIDQNAAGNTTADVRAGVLGRHQDALFFTAFDGVVVEGVAVDPATGVNTIALNGVIARGAVIRDCRIRFVKGRTRDASGRFDNSAIYVHGERFVVSGNRFENGGQPGDAVSAIEIHGGPGGVVTGNQVAGYFSGMQVVGGGSTEAEVASNDFAVVGNAITGAGAGIQLWALTGRALRNVTVSGNVISVANATLIANAYAGIALHDEGVSGLVKGDHDGIAITGNAISMARENRAGYAFSQTAGILAAPQGNVRSLVIANNVVRDSPSQGLRVESKTGAVRGLVVQGNLVVDAGNNAAAGPYRIGMIFAGKITGAQVRGNVLIDNGPPGSGVTAIHAAAISPGSDLLLEGNTVPPAAPSPVLR